METLPTDCPHQLGELINACRSYDAFQRPTAGGILSSCMAVILNVLVKQKHCFPFSFDVSQLGI